MDTKCQVSEKHSEILFVIPEHWALFCSLRISKFFFNNKACIYLNIYEAAFQLTTSLNYTLIQEDNRDKTFP